MNINGVGCIRRASQKHHHSSTMMMMTEESLSSSEDEEAVVVLASMVVLKHYQQCARFFIDDVFRPKRRRVFYRLSDIPRPEDSFWRHLDDHGTEDAFVHYTSCSRVAFQHLVDLCTPLLEGQPLNPGEGIPTRRNIRRRKWRARDVVAATLRWNLSTAGHKDLCMHFGFLESLYSKLVRRGNEVFVKVLKNHPYSRVRWHFAVRDVELLGGDHFHPVSSSTL